MNAMTMNQLVPEIDRRSLVLGSVEWLTRSIRTLDTWRQRHKSRVQFAGLDSRILRDSGISEVQRFIEGNKPFWQA